MLDLGEEIDVYDLSADFAVAEVILENQHVFQAVYQPLFASMTTVQSALLERIQ